MHGVCGPTIDAPQLGVVRFRDEALLLIGADGSIADVVETGDSAYTLTVDRLRESKSLTELSPGQYLLPGLVDLHNHAPQWPQLGKALDIPLADWLAGHTFPLEARYDDADFASEVYQSLVEAMIANGTTTAAYYATIHLAATKTLAEICVERGQRALVGRVAMDDPSSCPDYYRDTSAATAIRETSELIGYIEGLASNGAGLVKAIVTPRFIPSCTDDLLRGLGEVVAATDCHVQTHCSESDWAQQYGIDRFGQSDTTSYRDFGLLTRRTVLAHANFVSPIDMELIDAVGASIAHCPLSNVFFANSVFPTREALDSGVHIGLGTDVSAGSSPSVFNSAAQAVAVSRLREDGVEASVAAADRGRPGSRVTFAEAFWMATAGGGIALELPIGVLSPGYAFDAIVVDTRVADTDLTVWDGLDSPQDVFQKIILSAVRRNISTVWVQGAKVR